MVFSDAYQGTPLWRNGPPEKPVLCNACGSRYRIRGTLANYAPKHAQGQPIAKRVRISSRMVPKEGKLKVEENFSSKACHSTASDDSTRNKSSSEFAISRSCPQSCCKIKEGLGGEIPGEIQGSFWKSCIASRKRSLMFQQSSTVIERLQRDLRNILKQDPFILTENEEDLLIYNANNLQISYNEIGLGGFLLKPNSTTATTFPREPAPPVETQSSLVDDVKPSSVDIMDSGFNESQNRSSSK
ncbi:hypothetical protein GH714_004462 [Hevea brasiliensis]|uniref:GATA-type domain-containing protein n=1 Tax=Hevea brasiliensis TaxID=3981 RepID=A0A6A6L0J6_HEVBR|nr:hypothetical protein GH714_004462 [Hevea brasiliensis]